MSSERCSSRVLDLVRMQKSKCNIKKTILIGKVRHCYFHANMLYYKYLITIQKVYRGYIIRKKTLMFKERLPRDIQIKIIGYIRELTTNEVIKRLITKKINTFLINTYNTPKQIDELHTILMTPTLQTRHIYRETCDKMQYLLYLIYKYDSIILYTSNTRKFLELFKKYKQCIFHFRPF